MPKGCFKHSNFLKVNHSSCSLNTMKRKQTRQHDGVNPTPQLRVCRTDHNKFNYELFKRNNICICLWRLVLPRLLAPDLPSTSSSKKVLLSFHSNHNTKCTVSLFFVTTSSFQNWVIYAPAAFLRCGSHLSSSLSGIEPWFPVTRYNHRSQIHYRRKLMGQKLH